MGESEFYYGFSDESSHNVGQYRSISMISCSYDIYTQLSLEIRNILNKYKIKEFKWNETNDSRQKNVALEIIEKVIDNIGCFEKKKYGLRVDTIIWDTHDRRHDIKGRDDQANLNRMYYHLIYNVLKKRWLNNLNWKICPDENFALDIDTLMDCLESKSFTINAPSGRNSMSELLNSLKRHYNIKEFYKVNSIDEPLVQVADLLAGLARFSIESYNLYNTLIQGQSKLPLYNDKISTSNSDRNRVIILDKLNILCKKFCLGVSLNSEKKLITKDPKNPINFWWYIPQHLKDKAPVKIKEDKL